jgi:transcriptional regulator with XRE-family HTH domain
MLCMNNAERAALFTKYVGLELKGRIAARGFNALQVSTQTDHSPAAFNRWLNGKTPIPMTVLCEACEVIGVEPRRIVTAAYDRLIEEDGQPGEVSPLIHGEFGRNRSVGDPREDYDLVANDSIDETRDDPDSNYDNA